MKLTNTLIASAVLLATSSVAFAATDSTDIEILVTKDAYVNFVGSLQGNSTPVLGMADVNAATTNLGTLGTESNTTGACNVAFTSDNDFKMVHDTNAALFLHGTSNYSVTWAGSTMTSGAANVVNLTSCDNAASDMDLVTTALPAVVTAGTYKDTLHVVVTTQ